MKYRAILDEELKSMDGPPEDDKYVILYYDNKEDIIEGYHREGKWYDIFDNRIHGSWYLGWTHHARLEEVK